MFAEIFALLAGTGNLLSAYATYICTSVYLLALAHPAVTVFACIQLYMGRLLWGPRENSLKQTIIGDFVVAMCSPILLVVGFGAFVHTVVASAMHRVRRAFTSAWAVEKIDSVRQAASRLWVWSKLAVVKAWLGNHLEWVVAISFAAVVIVHQFKRFLAKRRERRLARNIAKGVTEESSRLSARHMMAVDYLLNCLNIAAAIVGVAAFGWDGAKKAGFNTFVLRTWRSAMGSGAPHKKKNDKKVNWKNPALAAYVQQQQEQATKTLAEFQGAPMEDLNDHQRVRLEEARKNAAHWAKEAAKIGSDESVEESNPFVKSKQHAAFDDEIEVIDEELQELSAPIEDTLTQAERIWDNVKRYGWAFTCVGLITAIVVGILYFIMESWNEEDDEKPAVKLVGTAPLPPRKRVAFIVAEALGLTDKVPEARRYVNPSPDDFALNDAEEQKELQALMEAKLEEMLERRYGGYSSESQRMGIFNDERDPRSVQKLRCLELLKKAIDSVKDKESEIVELESLTDDLALEITDQATKMNAMEAKLREATAAKVRLAEIEKALQKATVERDEARAALMKNDPKYAAHSVGFANNKIGDLELEQEKLRAQLEGKGKAHEGTKVCKGCNKPVDAVSPSAFCQDCRKKRTQQKKQARAASKEKPAVKPVQKESDSLEAELLKLASPEDVKEALQVNSALFTPKNGNACVKMVGVLDGTSETHFKNGTIVNGSLITVKHGCNKALDVSTALAGHHGVAEGNVLPIPEVDMCVYPAPKGNWGPTPKVRRAKQGEKCFVAYYATPESTELTFGAHGTIQDVGDPVKRLSGVHTCSTQKGASGCGVWAESDGAFLGVHEGTKDGRNVFVPVDATQLGKALDGKAIAWPSRSGN